MASAGDVDWATAELFAFGVARARGHAPCGCAGQDSRRGTFTQRHATLIDRNTGAEYTPLRNLSDDQAPFWAYDSLLSEFAAMGFEYGYSVVRDDALVCWEAQFGDFADGAQTIVDEFISSGEAKWGQRSAVTLLLPHGYEGQGPDHSSGRPERFLQLCAENNMTVAICSSPANYFHLLRRQGLSPVRRPLIAFTPKSLLRLQGGGQPDRRVHRRARSSRSSRDSTVDPATCPPGAAVHRQGLLRPRGGARAAGRDGRRDRAGRAALPAAGRGDPAPSSPRYPDAEIVWVQEEPANQGGWPFMALNLPEHLGGRPLLRVSRRAAASPAVGSTQVHEAQQREVVATAFS